MIRILTLAAVATALIAAPASAKSIHISTAGKSAQQLHADITKAAFAVCRQATEGSTFPHEEMRRCVKQTVAVTIAQSGDPALAAAAKLQLAQR